MKSNVIIVCLLVVLAVVVFRGNKNYNKLETERIERTFEIKQLKSLNERIEASNDKLAAENIRLNDLQIVHELKSDSLEKIINQTTNTSNVNSTNFDFTNDIYYSKRFQKVGRTATIGIESGNHLDEDYGVREAENIFYDPEEEIENLDQKTVRQRKGLSWEADFSYTEPLGKMGRLKFEYEIGNRIEDSDQRLSDLI